MESALCWSATPEHWPCPAVCLLYEVTLHCKLIFLFFRKEINSFLVRGPLWVHFPFWVPRFCLVWTWAGHVRAVTVSVWMCLSVSQFYRVWKMLFPESRSPLLALTILPPPLLPPSSSLEERGLIKTSYLRLRAPKSPTSCLSCGSLC